MVNVLSFLKRNKNFLDKYHRAAYLLPVLISAIVCISEIKIFAEKVQSSGGLTDVNSILGSANNFSGIEMVLITDGKVPEFWMSRYEVTQELYETVTGTNPSYFKNSKNPVEQVSWFDAVEFCNKLSCKSGLTPYYTIDKTRNITEEITLATRWNISINKDADGFRLPTSDEWIIAAKGGAKSKYFWGDKMDGNYCWYGNNSKGRTHPVGEKKANSIGIYDIAGNVREWCFDGQPSTADLKKVVHDGHYNMDEAEMMPVEIDYYPPEFGFGFIGIRLAKNK